MKNNIFILFLALMLVMSACVLASCTEKAPAVSTTAGAGTSGDEQGTSTPVTSMVLVGDDINVSDYIIVREMKAPNSTVTAVKGLRQGIKDYLGVTLKVSTDEVRKGEELDESKAEILVGETNRSVSAKAMQLLEGKENSFVILAEGNKIAIVGTTDDMTNKGVAYFYRSFVKKSESEGVLPIKQGYVLTESADPDSILLDNLSEMKIELSSNIYKPSNESETTVHEYPTILRLEHQENEEDNGKLLACFEKWGSRYPVYESRDDGKTWAKICTVVDNFNKDYWNEWMPFLYELPTDIGEFKKGTIILAATSISGGINDSTITLYSSTNLGKSFTAFCNVDKAGGLEWGVWEPYLIYDEKAERLYCFYSDDSDPQHSQKLVYKYTTDLVNWSEKFECVACDDPSLRPGMCSIAKMGNGEYYMVYEMVGINGNPVYFKKTTSLDDWGDVADYGEIVAANGETFGSAPYVAWTPAGGECGTLFVVGKYPVAGSSNTGSDMFISTDYGKTFTAIDNPIPYTLVGDTKCGYSPSFFVSSVEGTVYYVNNPTHGSGYKISMVKIKIYD